MTEEIKPEVKKEESVSEPQKLGQGNPQPEIPPTDFKIAEIWIRSGDIMLDAPETFWSDRCRALGVLDFCKDIIKTAQPPKKPNIIIPGNGGLGHKIMNFARSFKRKR